MNGFRKHLLNKAIGVSTLTDIDEIFRIYRHATEFQKSKFLENVWPEFDREMVTAEIKEQRQFKIEDEGRIACVWAITYNDAEIWGDRDKEPSLYIHRIATHPDYRGHNFVGTIVAWARTFAVSKNRQYIRLDTCGNNTRLIKHYTEHGFRFLGIQKLPPSNALPSHYHNADVCYFELALK